MTPDTLNWTSFLQVVAIPAFGVVLYALRELWKRMDEQVAAANKRVDEAHEAIAEVRAQVGAWQLETFKTFATKQDVAELRGEVRDGFAAIGSKLDRLLGGRVA